MKLFHAEATTTGEVRISKPVISLLIGTSADWNALNNATISAYIEKSAGNVDLLVQFPLQKFMLMQTFSNQAVMPFSPTNSLYAGICELSSQGAVHLNENESIKVKIDGVPSDEFITVYGIEDPIPSNQLYYFERKVCLSEEQSRKFNVVNNDLLAIDNYDILKDVVITYVNGTSNKYDGIELTAMALDIDPITLVEEGNVKNLGNRTNLPIILPLIGVESIEFNKEVGESLPIYLRSEIVNN